MTRVNATYDGEVLRPDGPLPLAPNTRVVVTVEVPKEKTGEPYAFLRTALEARLEGPPDWSERIGRPFYDEAEKDDE